MANIVGRVVSLRAVEPSDIELMYEWENDLALWGVSGTLAPFSHHTLSMFIEAQREDIYSSKQMRLMICDKSSEMTVGMVDLFEFDPHNHRVGVGIMVASNYQKMGYATDALKTVECYAREYLAIHQLWCNIESDNQASRALFEGVGYKAVATKKDWNFTPQGYKDEIFYQKIL